MQLRTPKQALAVADSRSTNIPGACQAETRDYYGAPSVGDFDGDGAADAEDGWKSEPVTAKRFDRNPPLGYPVAFLGGRNDNGHRAISRGHGMIRSTDFDETTRRYRAGVRGNGTIEEIERAMGVKYVGWSKTIDGIPIPPDPKPPKKLGWRVKKAKELLKDAKRKPNTRRARLLEKIGNLLDKIPGK
jgi:hypothetical protein